MLQVKSKYKVAKRLGPAVFEKTQTQKFALSEARSKASKKTRGGRGGGSDYGKQLLEKQRVRYTYGLSERQLSNYAEKAFEQADPSKALHQALESRLDSAVYRAGLASTRRAARQVVSHGHITVGGVRVTIPSHRIRTADILAVREGSRTSPLFAGLTEDTEEMRRAIPQWLEVDLSNLRAEIKGEPSYNPAEIGLDYATVFEFYSR
ncbi:30S ribosomal protein S4 [Candidatus Kaiserbacteria bacterium]|nr:30S ribosomal protein S4 [Candidatus Kaiserbacteria bacterium]